MCVRNSVTRLRKSRLLYNQIPLALIFGRSRVEVRSFNAHICSLMVFQREHLVPSVLLISLVLCPIFGSWEQKEQTQNRHRIFIYTGSWELTSGHEEETRSSDTHRICTATWVSAHSADTILCVHPLFHVWSESSQMAFKNSVSHDPNNFKHFYFPFAADIHLSTTTKYTPWFWLQQPPQN